MKSQEVNFQTSQKLLASWAGSSKQTIVSFEQFLRFSKNDLSWFNRIFLLFDARKSCVFQIFFLRSIEAYLCPNIIIFYTVDFSERRPEEVISFFWRSVYMPVTWFQIRKRV